MAISSNIIIILILVLQCSVNLSSYTYTPNNINRDESALLQFKSKIIDPEGQLEDWNRKKTVCKWRGVKCGVKHYRVTALNVSDMSLGGIIPPQLGNLSFLVRLEMKDNYLVGTLPNELVNLRRLKLLDISSNKLSGHIPFWMGSLPTQLKYLDLSYNSFTGFLDPSLFNLTNLVLLRIGNNSLQGDIPQEIGNLKHLIHLDFQDNNISGPIPNTIYNISFLEIFALRGNSVSGNIPPDLCHYAPRLKEIYLGLNQLVGKIQHSLQECSQLQLISLSYNNLTGSIPYFFRNKTMLKKVQLQGNKLSGELPNEVGNLQQLDELHIFDNSFTGVFPNSISNCSMLRLLYIDGNHFTDSSSKNGKKGGSAMNELSIITSLTKCQYLKVLNVGYNPLNSYLPKSIGNFSSLEQFFAQESELIGIIPDEIGNLTHLQFLVLVSNRLTGFIPSTINGLKRLEEFYLFENNLSGSIPIGICDLPGLGLVDLNTNKIVGELPTCLGTIRSLRIIELSDNLLESSIPPSLWNLTDLLELHLKSNRLNGSLPYEVGNLEVLLALDLSENKFSGKLPASLEKIVSLQRLDLSKNSLEGSIPESFGKMISLKSLDLSNNNLQGSIPYSLTTLQELVYFNVSNNKLVGEIPNKGPFVTFNASSFALNEALCGSSQYHVPPCVEKYVKKSKRRRLSWWGGVILGISSTLVALVLGILVWKHKRSKQLPVVEINSLPTIIRLSYYELLQATENFSQSNLLGEGSFGSVYKGVLNDGTIVAIKVFNLQATGALQSFAAECEVLRNLRHRNLTKVITSCSNNDDFKALVLEYISNGSLEKCLHLGSYFLGMMQRLNVMIDVAHALEYLHYGFSSIIVHCDLKPSNVLLDGDMMARLSDFGLTRFLNEEESFTYTKTLATLGYIAPEYGSEGLVSRACDVFSFGILMIETFTKRKPSDEMFTGDLNLKRWIQNHFLEDQLVQVIDSDLLSRDEQRFNQKMQSLYSVIELALNCCVDSPKERMNIKNVRVALEKIKLQYETSGVEGGT